MHHGKCTICSYPQASCVHMHVHHTLCTTTWALKCASLHCCTKYPLFIDIQSYVSLVHRSSNLKLFMLANIFWNSCIYPSLQVILIAIHKQLRATAPYDPAILCWFENNSRWTPDGETFDPSLHPCCLSKMNSEILVNKFWQIFVY
jgi:hypothetical protein